MFLIPVYFLLMTLGGVNVLNNLAKLKDNKLEQLYSEDKYLYYTYIIIIVIISNRLSMAMSSL